MPDLRELLTKYPLPAGWTLQPAFEEAVLVGRGTIRLSGLCARGPDTELVSGSAACADSSDSQLPRSYFELIERVSIVAAMSVTDAAYRRNDGRGEQVGWVASAEVFPRSPEPDRWRPARSNGVALDMTWLGACERAACELIERDRVLRAWYGETLPRSVALPVGLVPDELHAVCEWKAYDFAQLPGHCLSADHAVVAVVGIPKAQDTPLTYGFGARRDRRCALQAATTEAVQRLGFLFGEQVPEAPPTFSPTPDFHQDFFLYPPSHGLLLDWLDQGSVATQGQRNSRQSDSDEFQRETAIEFVDLTPPNLRGLLFVAKALCPLAEPLVFGDPAPHRERGISPGKRIHPVA